jgi:hypothetical protein
LLERARPQRHSLIHPTKVRLQCNRLQLKNTFFVFFRHKKTPTEVEVCALEMQKGFTVAMGLGHDLPSGGK